MKQTNKRILAILLSIWLLLPMSGMEILAQGLSDNSLENMKTEDSISEDNILTTETEKLRYGNSEYQILGSYTWENGKRACENAGGHMVTINSAGEQKFIADMIYKYYGEKNRLAGCWLGGYIEKEWNWVTGEIFNYTNWNQGEPSGGEKYLIMNRDGRWNDGDYGVFLVICEWDIPDETDLGTDVSAVNIPGNVIGICAVDQVSNRIIKNTTVYIDGTAYLSDDEGIFYFTDVVPGTKHLYYVTHPKYNVVPNKTGVFETGQLYKVYLTKKPSDTLDSETDDYVYGKINGISSTSKTVDVDGKEYGVVDSLNLADGNWHTGVLVYAALNKNGQICKLETIDKHIQPTVTIQSGDTPINYDGEKFSKDSIDLEVTLGCELVPKAEIPESLKGQSIQIDNIKLSFDGNALSFEKKGLFSDKIVNEKEITVNRTFNLGDKSNYNQKLYVRASNVNFDNKTDVTYIIHCGVSYGDEENWERLNLMNVQFINLPLQKQLIANNKDNSTVTGDYKKLAKEIQTYESQMTLPDGISELIGNSNKEKMLKEILSYSIIRDMACFKLKGDKSVSDEFLEKVFQITEQSNMIGNLFKEGHIAEQINIDTQNYGNQTIMFDVKYDVGGFNTDNPQYGIGWISYKVVGDKKNIKKVPKELQQSYSKSMITYADTQSFFDSASKCLLASVRKYYDSAIGDVDALAEYVLDDTSKKVLSELNWGWGTAESISKGEIKKQKRFANYKDAVWYIFTEPTKNTVVNGRVRCPVDIYLYNGQDELCGAIVNDEVVFANEGIELWVDGNEKRFQFLGDEYHIKYIGTDLGTMNCTINRFEDDITNPVRVIELYNIPLEKDSTYYQYIPENAYTNNSMYMLSKVDGGKKLVDYDSLNIISLKKTDVDNITLNVSELNMQIGDSKIIDYAINPQNATRKDVIWISTDETVATVDSDGTVYAKKPGQTQIIVRVLGENIDASCNVNVSSVKTEQPNKTEQAEQNENYNEKQIRAFVSRMYNVVLNREAEQNGLNDWSQQLINHTNDGAGLARGFICSAEFVNKRLDDNAYVNVLYKAFFDRKPDTEGKVYWLNALKQGTSRNEVLAGFVNSLEFANLCDSYGIARGTMESNGSSIYNAGVRNYVLRMYTKCLKRDGETLGVEDWSHRINTKAMDPETVAKSFFNSEEFLNKSLSNEDYIETLYETFMDRSSDAAGKADWVSKLNSGVSRQTVLEGFSRSPEFAKIMAGFGL